MCFMNLFQIKTPPPSNCSCVECLHTRGVTNRLNLFFAFAYNVVAIPLAVAGQLSPAIAGAAMAMSSVSVVGNALRLRGWRP